MRYGSLFAGAGLLDLGLHAEIPDLECVFAIEQSETRQLIFGAHNPTSIRHGDISSVSSAWLPAVDGVVGGVPCNTHSTGNTSGARGLAPVWSHAVRIVRSLRPRWTLWESSSKDQSWRRWVPFVRRDLWTLGHASVSFQLSTSGRGAAHDRLRAFVISWRPPSDPDRHREPPRAIHAAISSLRATPAVVWDGRVHSRAYGRLDDGSGGRRVDIELARAIGYGVDQRTARDAGRVLSALIPTIDGTSASGR